MITANEKQSIRGHEIRVCRTREVPTNRTFLTNVEREMGLTRLLNLLEMEAQQDLASVDCPSADHMSRIARLQSERAKYALATSTEMIRISNGAWLRRRYDARPASFDLAS